MFTKYPILMENANRLARWADTNILTIVFF